MAFPNRSCGRKSFPRGLSPKDTIFLQGDIFTPRICLTCPAQHFFCWGITRQGYLYFLTLASRMYSWTTTLTCTPIIPLAEGFFWLATSFTDNKNTILQGMVVTFYPMCQISPHHSVILKITLSYLRCWISVFKWLTSKHLEPQK